MLRPWKLSLREAIDPAAPRALHVQISHALIHEIRRGRLAPGAFLPSSRELSVTLGVNRKTVVAAYEDLLAQGWLTTSSTRGTQVAADLPELVAEPVTARAGFGEAAEFRFHAPEGAPFVLSGSGRPTLDEGSPDCRLFPVETLARAYRDALQRSRRASRLGYGDPRGSLVLRESLARMLQAQRGLVLRPENICVTRGSQMGIVLAARVLLAPGDVVLMEAASYAPAARAFRAAGAEVVTVGLDREGVDVEDVARRCQSGGVRAIFLTPHHHFPTTVTLRPERRLRLIELARRHGFAILEDDYDHEYHFSSQPLLPVASYAPGATIYVGSLSKLTLPSLRMGYIVAPSEVIDAIAGVALSLDHQGSTPAEEALADLIDTGELKRHVRRTHAIYGARRAVFAQLLRTHLGAWAEADLPDGGLAFWLRFRDARALDRLDGRGPDAAVRVAGSRSYALASGAPRGLRLGFASLDEREADAALKGLRGDLEPPS